MENLKKLNISKPLLLDCKQTVSDFPLAYETYGKLNENKDNAILVFHALTGDQFVTGILPKKSKLVLTFQYPKFGIDIITDFPILNRSFRTFSGL